MNKNGSATVVALVAVIILLVAGGVWYYEVHQSQNLTTVSNQPATATSTTSTVTPTSAPSTTTYVDPSGVFSFQYPTSFSEGVKNGDVEILLGPASYGDTFLQGKAFTATSTPFPDTDFESVSLDIYSTTSTTEQNCENPGKGTPSGTTQISTYNNIEWYEGLRGSAAAGTDQLDDFYQTYRLGSCWTGYFEWTVGSGAIGVPVNPSEPNGQTIQSLSNADVTTLEQSILSSFHFLK